MLSVSYAAAATSPLRVALVLWSGDIGGAETLTVALARAQDHVRRLSAKAEAAEFAAIEEAVSTEVLRVRPHVVVTFPIHGISGFHDHIATHAAVTRAYLRLHGAEHPWLQRLAFFTIAEAPADFPWRLNVTKPEEIDCCIEVSEDDMDQFHRALDCYVTYADVIAATQIHEVFGTDTYFEIYREDHHPP
jgi:N-acetylglucosamine malate deacetylase 2